MRFDGSPEADVGRTYHSSRVGKQSRAGGHDWPEPGAGCRSVEVEVLDG